MLDASNNKHSNKPSTRACALLSIAVGPFTTTEIISHQVAVLQQPREGIGLRSSHKILLAPLRGRAQATLGAPPKARVDCPRGTAREAKQTIVARHGKFIRMTTHTV
jgi:hypothetical protein